MCIAIGGWVQRAKTKTSLLVRYRHQAILPTISSDCTGVLLTSSYVLTAAHCTKLIDEGRGGDVLVERDLLQKCLESGLPNYVQEVGGERRRRSLKCKIIRTRGEQGEILHNIEILASPPGTVSVGVNQLKTGKYSSNYPTSSDFWKFSLGGQDVQRSNIKRIIRHAHTYRSYGYASYGGYDISLLELETPIRGFKFICLPRLSFDDISPGGTLAGYGLYLRNQGETCQTNEFGQFKGGSHHGIFYPYSVHLSLSFPLLKQISCF